MRGGAETGPPAETGAFRWEWVAVLMAALLVLLTFQLWRRVRDVDPLQRCAGAYENVHTALDTSLVDRIEVRRPDRAGRTTCGELRAAGELERLPRTRGPAGVLPPRP